MSGSANRWVLRLSTEGADQVIRDLRAAATESAAAGRAYDALIKAQPQLATRAERAEQALRKNIDAMRGMRGELNLLGAATQGVVSSMGSLGSALTSPAAAITALGAASAAGVVQIARIGDEYTNTMNKLRAATGSVQAASAVYAELVAMSQQTGASISESAGAFVRFSVAARAIGATNGEVLQLTRTIQQAGLISGASTQEAAAGVQQLGQALASGTLQGDELRSILENMPTLAEALAQQLGVSVGQLRTMGSEGQLTSDRVFQ
ncbi:MAG: tape measure protein, partial [Roseococcus sp.]|nr:tape measure protein [Roseococcus sp.]